MPLQQRGAVRHRGLRKEVGKDAENLRSKPALKRTELWGVSASLGLRVAFQFHVLPVHELLGSGLPMFVGPIPRQS